MESEVDLLPGAEDEVKPAAPSGPAEQQPKLILEPPSLLFNASPQTQQVLITNPSLDAPASLLRDVRYGHSSLWTTSHATGWTYSAHSVHHYTNNSLPRHLTPDAILSTHLSTHHYRLTVKHQPTCCMYSNMSHDMLSKVRLGSILSHLLLVAGTTLYREAAERDENVNAQQDQDEDKNDVESGEGSQR